MTRGAETRTRFNKERRCTHSDSKLQANKHKDANYTFYFHLTHPLTGSADGSQTLGQSIWSTCVWCCNTINIWRMAPVLCSDGGRYGRTHGRTAFSLHQRGNFVGMIDVSECWLYNVFGEKIAAFKWLFKRRRRKCLWIVITFCPRMSEHLLTGLLSSPIGTKNKYSKRMITSVCPRTLFEKSILNLEDWNVFKWLVYTCGPEAGVCRTGRRAALKLAGY